MSKPKYGAHRIAQAQSISFSPTMPLIVSIALLAIIIGLLFVVRQLKQENKELKQKVAEDVIFIQQLQTIDPLTRTLNRSHFFELAEAEWQRAKRNQHHLSLIACNIDCFRQYNDAYGSILGDECLFLVAQSLQNSAKRAGETIGRISGDDFWLLLPNIDQDSARKLAELIQQNISDLLIVHKTSPIYPQVTVSMGVYTVVPSENMSVQDCYQAVEAACMDAKSKGKNCWVVAY